MGRGLARHANLSLARRRKILASSHDRPIRADRPSPLPMPTTAGPLATSAAFSRHATAVSPGRSPEPAANGPLCSRSSPIPPTSHWNCSPTRAQPTVHRRRQYSVLKRDRVRGRALIYRSDRAPTRAALLLSGAASANTAWRFPVPAADLARTRRLPQRRPAKTMAEAPQQFESHLSPGTPPAAPRYCRHSTRRL